MKNINANNKRIVKNTIMLYSRMIITTTVSLFTARYTIQLLGVEDYGINNVVSGVIGFLGIVTHVLMQASQRFLAYDLGKNDLFQYRKTFSMLLNVFWIYTIVGILLMELFGIYAVQKILIIPENRLFAAHVIYQFTIITFAVNTLIIPYTSSIVSYEKMEVYAYFTLLDVVFKLLVVISLFNTPFDRLITLGFITMLMVLVTDGIILTYCKRKLTGCQYIKYWDVTLFKKIFSFAGWNMFGSISWCLINQGQTVLLNLFFGPIVNAAKAIADRINQIIVSFSYNFFMAVSPQIIKSYADGQIDYTRQLVLKSSKFSYFLLMVLSIPLMLNMRELLVLWLGERMVSDDMVLFSQLILLFSMINSLEAPISQAMRATGDIKKYQLYVGVQTLLFIPIAFVAFLFGMPAYVSMIILCIVYFIAQFTRIYVVKPILNITILAYVKKVISPIILISLGSYACSFIIVIQFEKSLLNLVIKIFLSLVIALTFTFVGGLSKKERSFIMNIVNNKLFSNGVDKK